MDLEVPELQFRDWVRVLAVEMAYPSSRVLLGRAFLRKFTLTFNFGGDDRFHWYPLGQTMLEDLDG
jgi:hypothetical protein